jgi:hypothetical protein
MRDFLKTFTFRPGAAGDLKDISIRIPAKDDLISLCRRKARDTHSHNL